MYWILLLVGIFALFVATFIIRRHLLFKKYMERSRIPFLKPKSYILGTYTTSVNLGCTKSVENCFRKKGDTYGAFMGEMPFVFTKDLDLICKIWVTDSHKHINRPFLGSWTDNKDVSLLQAEGNVWRKTRRAIGSTMTLSKLKLANVERDVDYCLNKLMASLERRSIQITLADEVQSQETGKGSVVVECSSMFKNFIMDLFMHVAFDRPDQIDYDAEENETVTNAEKIMKQMYNPAILLAVFIPQLAPLLLITTKLFQLNNFVKYMTDYLDSIIAKTKEDHRLGQAKSERRMIHSLLDLYKDGRLTKDELQSNVLFMLMAGWDTTSNSLTALMWQLAMHTDVQEKLRKEIVKDGVESEYLFWVIKESIRLHPPANTARLINEDFHWKGYTIMKGMVLIMQTYSLMRNKNTWGDDVDQFKPERFDVNNNVQQHPHQFVAFGLGPRNCVGYHLTMIEMKMTICRILLNYTIKATPDTPKSLTLNLFGTGTSSIFFSNVLKDKMPLEFVPLHIKNDE